MTLTKFGAPQIIITKNQKVVSPGVVKHALNAIGSYPISRLPERLEGRLAKGPQPLVLTVSCTLGPSLDCLAGLS